LRKRSCQNPRRDGGQIWWGTKKVKRGSPGGRKKVRGGSEFKGKRTSGEIDDIVARLHWHVSL